MNILSGRFTALILLLMSSQVTAETIWTADEFSTLCNNAKSPGNEMLASVMGDYLAVLKNKDNIDINHIKIPKPEHIDAALKKAIKLNYGALEFFTEPNFAASHACMVFMDMAMLQAVDKKYNLHTLWMINAPLEVDDEEEEKKANHLRMKYLLMGRGKLIIGYEEPKEIFVKDYVVFTGLYDYELHTSMNIVNSNEKRGVFEIRVYKSVQGKATPFIGPGGSEILSLEIAPDNKDEILIKCTDTWIIPAEQRVDRIQFEYRNKEI